MYVCGVAAVVAVVTWRRLGARVHALGVTGLCTVGAFVTLSRSVWLASVVATFLALTATRGLRRWVVAAAALLLVVMIGALVVFPGLRARAAERGSDRVTIWDRENLDRAALNMIGARPLVGFGWSRFRAASREYFVQAGDRPLTAYGSPVHNVYLSYASELGLIGLTLWAMAVATAAFVAVRLRGPPSLAPWRVALCAVLTFIAILMSFVPPYAFQSFVLWFFLGVVWSVRSVDPVRTQRSVRPIPALRLE
jgi:O-antigen ligase